MNDTPEGMFDDEDIMIFPESIDDIEPTKTSYLFTTTKLIMMFVGILPLIILSIVLLSEFGFIPALVFFVLYIAIYFYMVRLYVIEEPRQRESLNLLEDNKYSDYSFFWDITKAGSGATDNGLLYLVQDGVSLKRAYVVKYDSGSLVGVPENFLNDFRHTQQEFLRSVGMDIKWYSIQKKPTLNEALKQQSQNLRSIKNEDFNKLVKMQLNSYLRYSMDAEQRYVNYIIVINNDFEKLSSFRENLEDILTRTLRKNSSFKNVEILNKSGLDEFFSTYYMQDTMDISSIRKTGITKPFLNYAKIVNIVDSEGKAVPVEQLDEINNEIYRLNKGLTFEKIVENDLNKEISDEKLRIRQKEFADKEVDRSRRNNEITFEEYKALKEKIRIDYSPENFIPNREEFEKQAERERIRKEKAEKRLLEKQQREEEKRKANTPKPKWFEEGYEEEQNELLDLEDAEVDNSKNALGDNIDSILYSDGNTPNAEFLDDNDTEDLTDEDDIYSYLIDDNEEDK